MVNSSLFKYVIANMLAHFSRNIFLNGGLFKQPKYVNIVCTYIICTAILRKAVGKRKGVKVHVTTSKVVEGCFIVPLP